MSGTPLTRNAFIRDIPENLRESLIYHTHIFTNKKFHYDVVLTQGPILYEIQDRQILSICDLSATVLMGNVFLIVFNISANVLTVCSF